MAAKPVKIEKDNAPIDEGMEEAGHKADIAMSRSDAAPDDTPPDLAFGSGAGESMLEHGTLPPPEDFGNIEDAVGLESDPAMADGPDFAFGTGAVSEITIPSPETVSPEGSSALDDTPPDFGSGADSGLETDAAELDGFEPVDAGADAVPDAAPDDGADTDLLIG